MAKTKRKSKSTETLNEPIPVAVATEEATTPAEMQSSDAPLESSPDKPGRSQPFSIAHDNVAGVRLLKSAQFKQMQLQFAGDVPDAMHRTLEQNHWRYRPEEGVYTKQFGLEGEAAATISARRLFGELCRQRSKDQSPGR